MKILAVDDSPTMLEILSTTLSEAGHSVVEAGNGAEALGKLGEDVDMIISDLCVFTLERGKAGLTLVELAPGITLEEVAAKTEAKFTSAL